MSGEIEWIIVKGHGNKDIGAIGFLGNDAVAVTAFYDDLDGNKDGSVGWGEWIAGKVSPISMEGSAVTEVAMAARYDMDILQRDPSFGQTAMNMFLNFARGLVLDGVYAAYFSRPVGMIGGGVARTVASGTIKEFVIKKGFEKAVKEAFNTSMGR